MELAYVLGSGKWRKNCGGKQLFPPLAIARAAQQSMAPQPRHSWPSVLSVDTHMKKDDCIRLLILGIWDPAPQLAEVYRKVELPNLTGTALRVRLWALSFLHCHPAVSSHFPNANLGYFIFTAIYFISARARQ